ncbi:group II intron reverse transcriptase/maturase [Nocardia sp. CA-120079]|uniref:group II intron reverse transcriptase/maturase n=1 Tax=Nocardia sp. CA-120079 TaxID=3239974 RepID=UPI003D97B0C4
MNIGAALGKPFTVKQRVLSMQSKLHCWAAADRGRRFDDLYNLVSDPCFLVHAWDRVAGNTGARTAGIDKRTVMSIENSQGGTERFLEDLRAVLKARAFRPEPVRQVRIAKANGKLRSLGIPTVADRVAQAALKLVLEPIFEAGFSASSYGFRPNRRAQDAIQDIRHKAAKGYVWVFETDIAACFDEIDHTALMDRVRDRIADKHVLALVKSFLKAGILGEDGVNRDTWSGTPQGGILSPLLANIALTDVDDHFDARWAAHRNSSARERHRKRGGATYRLVRYADDFVVLVHGTREHAEALHGEIASVLAPLGLRMAPDKTRIAHIDEGIDFLGFRIRRHTQRGGTRRMIYSYPSEKSAARVRHKIKAVTKQISHRPADEVFKQLNRLLRGWTQYFRFSCAAEEFKRLHHYLWWRVWSWAVHKHPRKPKRWIWVRYNRRRWPEYNGVRLFDPSSVHIQRYRHRGSTIPTPWHTPCAAPAA